MTPLALLTRRVYQVRLKEIEEMTKAQAVLKCKDMKDILVQLQRSIIKEETEEAELLSKELEAMAGSLYAEMQAVGITSML